LITEGETWPGFYASYSALKHGKFNRVVVAVKDRNTDLVKQIEKLGGEIKQYDPSRPDQVKEIFKGIDALLLIPVCSENIVEDTKNIIEAAERQEVKRMVFWSLLGSGMVEHGTETVMDPSSKRTTGAIPRSSQETTTGHYKQIFTKVAEIERIVRRSKIENECIMRIGFCMQQFFALSNIMQSRGIFPLPSSSSKFAPVNAKDVGHATVHVLVSNTEFEKYKKQTLQLTGPQTYNGPTLTQVLNRTLNSRIEFQEVSLEQMRDILEKSAGDMLDKTEIQFIMGWLELLKENKLDVVTKELHQVLGHEPADVKEFFEENQDAFRPHGNLLRKLVLQEVRLCQGGKQ
jgi:hypothetical protein